MDKPTIPASATRLTRRLWKLHQRRKKQHRESRRRGTPRRQLTKSERAQILEKTGNRCHNCGGDIQSRWQADHVLAHSSGGRHSVENYLPAHRLCNNYRWDYSSEEFQWILKLGVWARTQIERHTSVGASVRDKFAVRDPRLSGEWSYSTTSRYPNADTEFRAISEFPKWRKYLISLSFRGQSSVRPVQVGGFDVNIVIHRSTAVRGRGGPARHDAWPPSLGAILAHTDGPCGS